MFKKRWQNKDFRILCFTLFNAVISFIWTQLVWLDWANAALVVWLAIPLLNIFTKYANNKWFGDLWVDKKETV